MSQQEAIDALANDLNWQIDQLIARGIKNDAGRPYNPSHYKRGLRNAIEAGGLAIPEFVTSYVHKAPSAAYKKLEEADALDLACEALVAYDTKPYADLFSAEDREAARERLGHHVEAIEQRQAEQRARIEAATERLRARGLPHRFGLDSAVRSRRA